MICLKREGRRKRQHEIKAAKANSYLIVTEGKCTEPNYFRGLKKLISEKIGGTVNIVELPSIDIHGEGSSIGKLIEITEQFVKDAKVLYQNIWIVFVRLFFSLDKYINLIYSLMYQLDIWRKIMNRQKIRKLILIVSLLLFPVTIWYMSPYLIIQGAMEGIVTGSFIVFVCMLLASIFFGRIFCGWLCPMGGMQECLFSVNEKVPKQGWKNNIKYIIWTAWIIAIIICFIFRKEEISINFFYMTDHGISIAEIYDYIIYYGVIFLVLIPAVLFGKRIFCHYFCWMAPFMVLGTKIRRFLHLPGLHIAVKQPNACISCGKCNKECPMGIKVSEMIIDGEIKSMECIQCGACIDGCPKKVLSYGMAERKKDNGNRKED